MSHSRTNGRIENIAAERKASKFTRSPEYPDKNVGRNSATNC